MIPKRKSKMRILFIHNAIAEYRIEFMRSLSSLCDIKFFITDKGLASSIYGTKDVVPNGVHAVFLKNRWSFSQIKKELLATEYDIVVLPPVDDVFQYFCCLVVLKYANRKKTKITYWSEGWQKDGLPFVKACKKFVHRQMKQTIFNQCDLLIASGSKANEYYLKLQVPAFKIHFAIDSSTSPNSQFSNIRKFYNIPENSNIVLFLGRLIARKGGEYLIKAFDSIAKENKNTYLLICGEGLDKRNCEFVANSMDSKNRIIFGGMVSPSDRSAYYRESDVFVLPSYSLGGTIEAWGLTVNEALEQGTPVVATDVVGAAYDLLDGKCGIMVKERNINEMSKAINHFLNIKDREKQSEYCKKRYEQFSVDNMAKSFYEAFKSVLENES